MATACADLFLVLGCQENMAQGGLVAAKGGFQKWKEIKFHEILFCRIFLLLIQFMATPLLQWHNPLVSPFVFWEDSATFIDFWYLFWNGYRKRRTFNFLMKLWFFKDLLTALRLPDDCPRTACWLPSDCLETARQLSADCLATARPQTGNWPATEGFSFWPNCKVLYPKYLILWHTQLIVCAVKC